MRRRGPLVPIFALLALLAAGCAEEPGERAQRDPRAEAAQPAAAASGPTAPVEKTASTSPRRERPLPAYEGFTLDDGRLSVASLLGRRLLLFFFNPEVPEAEIAAAAVQAVSGERGAHNFALAGVAQGAAPEKTRAFAARHGLDFPIWTDDAGRFSQRLGLRSPVALLLVDAEGYVLTGATHFAEDLPDPAAATESVVRDWLRLPAVAEAAPVLGERPLGPDFAAPRLGGGEPFEWSSLRGRPAILIFFLHTCPHCHHALKAIRSSLESMPEPARPALVGVSVANRPAAVRDRLRSEGLDFFPVVFDPEGSIRSSWGAVGGVPVVYLTDAEGRIVARTEGWQDERDPPLLRMRLAALAGQRVPMLLHTTGYSGNDFCAVCHPKQEETWQLTTHATAFDTLVRHGAERNGECVGCHVVGYERPGGYALARPEAHLEGVGCESCHGRGGPHLSPDTHPNGSYEAGCVGCHDSKHSLGFDYAEFVPKVSHAANQGLAGLSLEEKRALLAERRKPRALLPTQAEYVGSQACRSCHTAEYETWSAQPHARAVQSLAGPGERGNAECLACHTTGYGQKGGFPAGAAPDQHPDLVGVGCESCHGPGGEHVAPGAARRGTIVSLGDKCDSCVILQICGSCHDDANDPGFEFEVQEKIERQRHGSPSEGAQDATASAPPAASSAWLGVLERAFAEDAPEPRG